MVTAIIAAAGQGKRMGMKRNKLFVPLFHEPILLQTVKGLAGCPAVTSLIVVAGEKEVEFIQNLLKQAKVAISWQVVVGAAERQYSIANALKAAPDQGLILIHDGARPLIDRETVAKVIEAAEKWQAAVVGVPVKDTVKQVEDGVIVKTPDRKKLWAVQTPQIFAAKLIKRAYQAAAEEQVLGTDDASLVERLGVQVKMVQGKYENIKITTPEDITVARAFMGETALPRMGFGYDVHAFEAGRDLMLGGVHVPSPLGLAGHSDADVLLHAIADALLGAAGLGDIGRHFPDTDPAYLGISSLVLLDKVAALLRENGYGVHNVDATIVAQQPKLAPYIAQMNRNIAQVLGTCVDQINVKATTTEGLGFAGRKEGMAAYAVVSLHV